MLDKVKRTGNPVLVTRRGIPIAMIEPPPPPELKESWLGAFKSKGKIMGDIVVPASDETDDIYESIKRDNQLMISSMVLPSFRLTRPSSEILK